MTVNNHHVIWVIFNNVKLFAADLPDHKCVIDKEDNQRAKQIFFCVCLDISHRNENSTWLIGKFKYSRGKCNRARMEAAKELQCHLVAKGNITTFNTFIHSTVSRHQFILLCSEEKQHLDKFFKG